MSQNNVEGFRLSPQQRHVWSLQQVSAVPIYQVLSTISINGNLSADILERAFADVVRRHEILRTTFQRPSGIKIPFQVISDAAPLSLQFSDLSNLDHERQRSKLEESFAAESGRSFDFDRGPLLRASLFKLSSEEHLLLISFPALCGDSVTLLNLMSELGRAYALILQGGAVLDEPMQYADFAEWHNELLQSSDEHAEQGRNFWNELKRGLSPLSLPLEKRKTADQTFHPEAVSIDFDPSFVTGVDALAHECETSTQVVLFTCWQAIVSRLTKQSHFVIFNLFDGRKLEDLKSAFGLYAKYLPVA